MTDRFAESVREDAEASRNAAADSLALVAINHHH